MAMIDAGSTVVHRNIFASFLGGIADVARSIKAFAKRRRTLAELSSLDDRTLRDIGISRGEIQNLAFNNTDVVRSVHGMPLKGANEDIQDHGRSVA